MTPRGKRILWISITAGVLVVGAAIATPMIISANKKRNEEEVAALINLAGEESKLNSTEVIRLREIYTLKNYQLPAPYQNAWNSILPDIQKAISSLKAGYLSQAQGYVKTAVAKVPANLLPDFSKAYNLFQQVTSAMMDYQSVLQHKGWMVKAGKYAHLTNSIMKWNIFSPPSMLIAYINTWTGVDKKFQETAAIKSNPIYLINKDLIFNKNYSMNVLKLFDLMWLISRGENYFNINANSVSLK